MRAKYPAAVNPPLRHVASKLARSTLPMRDIAHSTKRCGGSARSRALLASVRAQSVLLMVIVVSPIYRVAGNIRRHIPGSTPGIELRVLGCRNSAGAGFACAMGGESNDGLALSHRAKATGGAGDIVTIGCRANYNSTPGGCFDGFSTGAVNI